MPEINLDDTIVAISTPPGEGGIGVIRLSGPKSIEIAARMFRPGNGTRLENAKSHTVHFGLIADENNEMIDQVLVSIFRSPKSYTAENVIEISAHGGLRVLQKILNLALRYGARQAEPGEFTKRAFLNGRLDLTQAEAVLDLIRARTDRSLGAALEQLKGKLSAEINSIKEELMKIYAHLEAFLDFPDEHLEVYNDQEFKNRFEEISARLRRLIQSFSKGEILREGALVVLVGRANVGKSSLMNALLERDRALVSEIPGTTRDVLEESVELNGLWIRLVDTAGLWSSEHPLDLAAMERAKRYLELGHLFIWVTDAVLGLTEEDLAIWEKLKTKKVIPVVNKIDLPDAKKDLKALKQLTNSESICLVSAKTREGIELLEEKIAFSVLKHELNEESVLITRARHKRALEVSLEALEKSFAAFSRWESLEFVALDLKQSLDALREFVGEIYSEDLLDVIFREFCLGK